MDIEPVSSVCVDYSTFNTSSHDRSHIFRKGSLLYGCFRCELGSGWQFECYLDFCLVLNAKLNICTKFVNQYMSLQVFQDASRFTLIEHKPNNGHAACSSDVCLQECHICYK